MKLVKKLDFKTASLPCFKLEDFFTSSLELQRDLRILESIYGGYGPGCRSFSIACRYLRFSDETSDSLPKLVLLWLELNPSVSSNLSNQMNHTYGSKRRDIQSFE